VEGGEWCAIAWWNEVCAGDAVGGGGDDRGRGIALDLMSDKERLRFIEYPLRFFDGS
jgi:hypothetical protein